MSIYKIEGGYFLAVENMEFTPSGIKKSKLPTSVDEFKLTGLKNNLQDEPESQKEMTKRNAAMGIRTPVASVRGSHDWPDYTIAAQLLNNMGHIFT